ncbi:hypothetical protein RND81_08G104300 [Saponaria officinalis]|uniref:Uncharacterized protein n=1 Tax=Saponaria officinalis TaxID=3572 RepID=A0AAW1J5W9_SAPOF
MTNPLSSILHAKRSFSIPLLFSSSASESSNSSETGSESQELVSYKTVNNIHDICYNNIPCNNNNINVNNNKNNKISGTKSYKLLEVISGHVGGVTSLALCGEFVLSASQGKDIIVWQQPDLRQFTKFGSGEGSVKALVTVGNKVFTAHQDSRIRVWKVSRRSENVFRLVETLPTKRDYIGQFMKQSSYVQVRRHHKKLWIEHVDSISCLAVENGLIYSGSWDKYLKVWRLSDLRCLDSIKAHDDAINGLIAKNGKVYSASGDGKVKVWVKQGKKGSSSTSAGLKLERVLEGHKDVSINSIILCDTNVDNGADRVYSGASDGYLMGWERKEIEIDDENQGKEVVVEWKRVVEVKAHKMAILCLSVMGEILCSGSADKSICLWKRDVIKGVISKVGVIRGHEGPIKCLQVSPNCVGDGFLLYSGSLDKSLRVWWVPKDINEEQDI